MLKSNYNRKTLDLVDWTVLSFNKNVHEQVSTLNRTLMSVFSNFIPNKVIDFNGKDPSWMTLNLKDKLKDDLKNGRTIYNYL